jgi:hypothetical protein
VGHKPKHFDSGRIRRVRAGAVVIGLLAAAAFPLVSDADPSGADVSFEDAFELLENIDVPDGATGLPDLGGDAADAIDDFPDSADILDKAVGGIPDITGQLGDVEELIGDQLDDLEGQIGDALGVVPDREMGDVDVPAIAAADDAEVAVCSAGPVLPPDDPCAPVATPLERLVEALCPSTNVTAVAAQVTATARGGIGRSIMNLAGCTLANVLTALFSPAPTEY